jgi:hypothetical protein
MIPTQNHKQLDFSMLADTHNKQGHSTRQAAYQKGGPTSLGGGGHTENFGYIQTMFSKVILLTQRAHKPQQKNIELHTFSCNLGSCGTGTAPADVKPPWLEDVSDKSSNFMNCPIWVAAKCA